MLEKDNSVSIHHKSLQALAIEIFKVHTKTSPEIMQELFLINPLSVSEVILRSNGTSIFCP